jgi:hypothetical protein
MKFNFGNLKKLEKPSLSENNLYIYDKFVKAEMFENDMPRHEIDHA